MVTKSLANDPSSPYFLSNGDKSLDSFVSEPLNGDNYFSWSRAMLVAISGRNKKVFIDGTISKPSPDNLLEFHAWKKVNDVVMLWIVNSLSKEIAKSIINSDSAFELWKELKERFHRSNSPQIFKLRQEIANLKQNQDTVTVYFTKLKKLWEELSYYRPACACNGCTCGGFKSLCVFLQSEYIMSFLMGLNESLSQIRGEILLLEPLPPINKAFSLVYQEERRIKIHGFENSSNQNSAADPTVQNIAEDSTLNIEEKEEEEETNRLSREGVCSKDQEEETSHTSKVTYKTREELLNHVKAFCLEKGFAVKIKNSKKDEYIHIGCDRGGTYRNHYNVSAEFRKRKRSSRLIDCPFKVKGKKQRNGKWLLDAVDLTHNHEPSTDMSVHPSCRRLSEEEMKRVEEMSISGIPPRDIISALREKNPSLLANAKTISNTLQKIRKNNSGEQTGIQDLTKSGPSRSEVGEKKTRKCSKCKDVGHDTRNCPGES